MRKYFVVKSCVYFQIAVIQEKCPNVLDFSSLYPFIVLNKKLLPILLFVSPLQFIKGISWPIFFAFETHIKSVRNKKALLEFLFSSFGMN